MPLNAYRAEIFHLRDDPARDPDAGEHIADGLLVVRDGRIEALGPYAMLAPRLDPGTPVTTFPGGLIAPGFIDCHVHFPQVDVIASYGARLMDWLQRYTFPAEMRLADDGVARETAGFFLDELLRNGTTSALVYSTIHTGATTALFEAAQARGIRIISGKTLMDRAAPAGLLEDAAAARKGSLELIEEWHGKGRIAYAVTPRFAVACSDELLTTAGDILKAREGLYLHTHLAESPEEIAEVGRLFPRAKDYLGVYEDFGFVRDRSVFAHGVHLDRDGFARLAAKGAAVAHCPTSNTFLGSGLFDLKLAEETGTRVGLATDVGGGTSFSQLASMAEAYRVAQLRGRTLTPLKAFYLATLGAARALRIDDKVGSLAPGKEADFVVLDRAATPLIERRLAQCETIADQLFALSILGDDRVVAKAYVIGRVAHDRDAQTISQLR